MNLKQIFTQNKSAYEINSNHPEITHLLAEKIISFIPQTEREYVIVCIGTDRSTGDAFGPLTGTYLQAQNPHYFHVYGTIDDPIHATNLEEKLLEIQHVHRQPFIIAIDASLGTHHSIGSFIVGKGSIQPGAALKKSLPVVGDIHVAGIVNVGGFMEYTVLQNTRLSTVMGMAGKLAETLGEVNHQLQCLSPMKVLPNDFLK